MKTIDADYSQTYLLPPSIEDWISADHPARFIREMVSEMDLAELGIEEQLPAEGRPPYANALLLRVWLYGYWKRIRASRKLEEACRDDIGFIWLCGEHRPDHNTLWRFFNRYRTSLRSVFKQTVLTAMRMDLVGLVLQAVDGTKIQAACSGWKSYRLEDLERLEEELNKHVESMEAQIEQANRTEPTNRGSLPEELTKASALREKIRGALKEAKETGSRHVQPHETDARRMGCDNGNRFGYNAQAVVDHKHQIIVAEEVTADSTDYQQLSSMSKQARENTGEGALTLADAGYSSGEGLKKCAKSDQEVLVNLLPLQSSRGQHEYHSSRFSYEKEADVVICPEGRTIPFQRIRKRRGKEIRVYRSAATCKDCPSRQKCTRDRHGRTIEVCEGYQQLRDMDDALKNPTNRHLLAYRKAIVEPVFAGIKAHGRFRRWTSFGLENAQGQWALLSAVWNLKVIYRYWMKTRNTAAGNSTGNSSARVFAGIYCLCAA